MKAECSTGRRRKKNVARKAEKKEGNDKMPSFMKGGGKGAAGGKGIGKAGK